MSNFFESMRLKNLSMGGNPQNPFQGINFGSTDLFTPPMATIPPPMESPSMDNPSMGYDMPPQDTSASDAYNQLLGQYPQRENPSILRRIGSMLVDYTKGPQAGQAMMDQGFNDKLTDWKNQVGPAQQAANLERYENVNNRTIGYQQASIKLREEAQNAKEKNDINRTKIAQQRADIYDFKARNPHLEFNFNGPKVKIVDPLTGKITETEFDTGNLTVTDKMNLAQKQAIAKIEAAGEQARQTENTRQTGRENIAETRGWSIVNVPDKDNPGQMKAVKINQITGEVKDLQQEGKPIGAITKPSSTSAKGELPSQTKVRQYNAARELANSRPDLAPFIQLNTSNEFTITPQSDEKGYFSGKPSGPSKAQFKEINDKIYGGMISPVASHSSTLTTAPKAPAGWKYIPKSGGGWTAIPVAGVK